MTIKGNNCKLKIFVVSFLFFLFFAVIAAKSAICFAKKTSDQYAKFGAVLLYKNVTVKLNRKYQLKTYITKSIKILNQRGINRYSEVIVPFSLKYQRIKLLYGYSLLKGMFKVPVGKHAVNIVSPSIAVNYPSYSSIKYLTLSMPAVEPGSVINFSYKLNDFKPVIQKGVFYTDYLSGSIPVKESRFTLIYPAGMKINLYLHNLNKSLIHKKIIIIKAKKYIELSLNLKDIPAVKKESYMPPIENYEKYISFSTYTSWKNLLERLNEKFKKSEKTDKNIEKFVKKAVLKLKSNNKNISKSKREKIALIYDRFVKSFRYVGIGYGINGYNPAITTTTFSSGYGDSKSLASLLITMLKAAGIKAYPVPVISLNGPNLNINSISPKQFDKVIVGVDFNRKQLYLYPDSSSYKAFSLPFILSGRKAVVLLPDYKYKFITLPVQKSAQNEKIFKFKGKIYKTGKIKGQIINIDKGIYANFKRTTMKNESSYDIKNQVSDFLYNFVPGADILHYHYKNINNVNKNIILKIKFLDKNYGRTKGDKIVFHQVIPYDKGLLHLVLKNRRIYPLVIGYPFKHVSRITLILPKKSNIYFLPEKLKIINNTGMASADCRYVKTDHALNCYYEFESKSAKISEKDYKDYKNLISAYLGYLKNYFIVISSIYFY